MSKFILNIFQAFTGDSILINYIGIDSKQYNILIDGGMPNTFKQSIKKVVQDIDYLDYIFLTHIDRDHIGGVLKLIESSYQNKIKNIFFYLF